MHICKFCSTFAAVLLNVNYDYRKEKYANYRCHRVGGVDDFLVHQRYRYQTGFDHTASTNADCDAIYTLRAADVSYRSNVP